MRVLFVSLPEKSHLYCMVPLAWAMVAAGHEVRVAAPPSFVPAVVATGLPVEPLDTDRDLTGLKAAAAASQDHPTASWSRCEPGEVTLDELVERFALSVPYGFALYNDHLVDDLVGLARRWGPDLVVHDPLAFAAGVAAHVVGARAVRLLWCVDVWSRSRRTLRLLAGQQPGRAVADPVAEWLAGATERHGVDYCDVVADGHATVDMLPASLRLPSELREIPMRFVAHNGPAAVPAWLREQPARPRVCLTLGTSNIEGYGADYVSVPTVLEACADLEVEVVAALVPAQRAAVEALGPLPANARLVDPVALHLLLPSCAAIVHHGGFGSFATALAAGVPQLVVSTSISDHERRCRGLEEHGAGRFLHHGTATPDDVRAGVAALTGTGPRHAAAALAAEVAAMPSPAATVATLESMTERIFV